ncbi:MAG TPA: hypothetical protein ENN11_05150 [Methanomicrobia archaeon]|nr:hypothetical protein [Methanomicrobia archaeon]
MDIDLGAICGEKTAAQLYNAFGSDAVRIVRDCEVERLVQLPGFGRKKALAIVRKAYAHLYDEPGSSILTGHAEDVYDMLQEFLSGYVVTAPARNKLLAYIPLTNRDLIEERQRYFQEAGALYERVCDRYGEIARSLGELTAIKEPEIRKYYDYVLLTDSNEAQSQLKNPHCDVLFMDTPDEAEYARSSYSFVIYVAGTDSELEEYGEQYADRICTLAHFDLTTLIPDQAVEKFMKNERTLRALRDLRAMLDLETDILDPLLEALARYRAKDGAVENHITPDQFVDIVRKKEGELNKRILNALTERDLGIKATRLLDLVSSIGASDDPTEAIRRSLPVEFDEVYHEVVSEVVSEIEDATGIDASSLFPDSFSCPISIEHEPLYDLRRELETTDFKSRYDLKQTIASFSKRWPEIDAMLDEAVAYDFMLAMGRFIHDNGCCVPEFVEDGMSFREATNVFIDGATPVSYKIGATPHDIATSDRITVLTGANSGGKTTLLETGLTLQLLAQMGMPVPASEMHTTIFESIRYLAKAKSQNAGAFETTLTSLVPVATDSGKRLILIDELESITEPGSAARIIATLITILQRNEDAYAIIVTHLGEEIEKLCTVRIDGIEARGLDEDLNLIVERQPAFGRMGKSTPELIVEKLYRSSTGDVQKVYGEMLEQLKKR